MRFLIVDDHAVVRDGLTALLRQAEPRNEVLTASDGAEALELARLRADLDAVLVDLRMPGIGGIALIEAFAKQNPALPVIVLSSSESPQDIRGALAMGALGYVPKSASSKTLLAAIRMVLDGDVYVPPILLSDGAASESPVAETTAPEAGARLTDRQADVLRLIGRGLSNKEIALTLDLSEKTVKVHVTGIFKTLNVVNRVQAAVEARRIGLT